MRPTCSVDSFESLIVFQCSLFLALQLTQRASHCLHFRVLKRRRAVACCLYSTILKLSLVFQVRIFNAPTSPIRAFSTPVCFTKFIMFLDVLTVSSFFLPAPRRRLLSANSFVIANHGLSRDIAAARPSIAIQGRRLRGGGAGGDGPPRKLSWGDRGAYIPQYFHKCHHKLLLKLLYFTRNK